MDRKSGGNGASSGTLDFGLGLVDKKSGGSGASSGSFASTGFELVGSARKSGGSGASSVAFDSVLETVTGEHSDRLEDDEEPPNK